MLGGVGDVRYVSGARQLGRSGVLPFAPVAVVVRKTGRVHLLSTWDEGVPPEIGRDDLYRLSWNPANLAADLAKIPGLREARRVGTDGLTPMFAGLIPQLVTPAELVDAAPVMASARRTKTPDEITCLDVASAIAEAALSAMEKALTPGITERELLGIYDERIASLGAPMPPSESVCFATPSQGPVRFRHLASDRPIGEGELVVLAPGGAVRRIRGRAGPHPGSGQCCSGADGRSRGEMCAGHGRTDRRLPPWQYRRRPIPSVGERRQPRSGGRVGAWAGIGRRAAADRPWPRSRRHHRGGNGAERSVLGQRGRRRRMPGARYGAHREQWTIRTHALRKVVITSHRTVFDHVVLGVC